jgi:predicted acyl esterase
VKIKLKNIFLFVFLTIISAIVLVAQTRHDLYISVTHEDSLDATYFVPNRSAPLGGYPAILFVHGFGSDKYSAIANCSTYALSGYLTMTYSVRGHGSSSGASHIMSMQEREDLAKVLDYLRNLSDVDSQNVGISGGSQGGLHGLWAIADNLPVRATSSDVIIPNWASDMLMNGSVRRTLLLLLTTSSVRYNGLRDTLWDLLRKDEFDVFSELFVPDRDVDASALNTSTIPQMLFLKWQDHYFSAAGGIEAFSGYGGPKKIYLGTRGHFSDQAESERLFQYDQVTRWLNCFLKGTQNGILDEPIWTYAYSSLPMDSLGYFTWTRSGLDQWPPAGIQPVQFYLDSDSTLVFEPSELHKDTFTLSNDYFSPAYTFDTAFIEGFRGARFDALLPKHTLQFTSPPLDNEVLWIGSPSMKLFVSSAYNKFPIHVQVYEVDNLGRKYFINRINFTCRDWQAGTSGWIEASGISHAHKFSKGNKIRVELTNIDKTNRLSLGDHPFVVPMFAQTGVAIYSDNQHPSYIELPLIGSPTLVKDDNEIISVAAPRVNNYPNPFNPSTNISFTLWKKSRTAIIIYNTLGQAVKAFPENVLSSGSHNVTWNAASVPSGVYFCVITISPLDGSNPVNCIRKMLLLR